jgi:hypothetical protein
MHAAVEQPGEDALGRPQWLTAYQVVSGLTAALVLIMAVLAGRGWFIDFDLINVHGVIGNIVFLFVLAQTALAFGIGLPRSLRNQLLVINVVLLVLVIAQIGLGYTATSDKGSAEAAAWHIPNGVLIFGLVIYHLALVTRLRR